MARKYGRINKMSKKFEDYSYIINGVGGIGKTTLVYEIGKIVTGSDEGTFIITCGGENEPKHIEGAFGDVAKDFQTFAAIVKELCEHKSEYPYTRFVAIDSLDEYARITENYVVAEWNKSCDINDRAKSIAQAYKGFQKGENRACDLMIQQIMKLQQAGYSILEIGHTKTKLKEDVITKVQFEQLTCNLDNKYYNALKDKVNLVAMCYWENTVENIETKQNAFTKKMDKVGELTDRKRVMVFADNDNAIDIKTHFEYITHKIDLSAEGFIKAVEDAIIEKLNRLNSSGWESTPAVVHPTETESSMEINNDELDTDEPEELDESISTDIDDEIDAEIDDEVPFDEGFVVDEECIQTIKDVFKNEKDKAKRDAVRAILAANGGKLTVDLNADSIKEIMDILGIK